MESEHLIEVEKKSNSVAPTPSKNISLPIMICDNVICDNWYMIRLTPFDAYTFEDMEEHLFKNWDGKWVCGQEISSKDKPHFHLIVNVDYGKEDMRCDIKNFLNIFFDTWEKADGNKRYNLQVAESIEKAIQYTIKDKNHRYGNKINTEFITACENKSYAKYDKCTFMSELQKIRESFKADEYNARQAKINFALLKGKYGQSVDVNMINKRVLSWEIEKDPSLATSLF